MQSLVKQLAALHEKNKVKKFWREILTPDTLVDPPMFLEDKDLDFDDKPTLDYDWRNI